MARARREDRRPGERALAAGRGHRGRAPPSGRAARSRPRLARGRRVSARRASRRRAATDPHRRRRRPHAVPARHHGAPVESSRVRRGGRGRGRLRGHQGRRPAQARRRAARSPHAGHLRRRRDEGDPRRRAGNPCRDADGVRGRGRPDDRAALRRARLPAEEHRQRIPGRLHPPRGRRRIGAVAGDDGQAAARGARRRDAARRRARR